MVHDLQSIIGCPLDKIYQLSRNEILIKYKNIHTNTKESLFIRNGEFACLTEKQIKTPQTPSTFAMALRKYIQNGRITSVSQHEFDRIIIIKIGKKTGEFSLVIEFFSEGNIILVDPNNNIILPFIHQSWAHRKVKGRQPYVPPPSQINPTLLDKNAFLEKLHQSNADLVRTLAVNINLSGHIAEEICIRSQVSKETKIEDLNENETDIIYDALQQFLSFFKKDIYHPLLIKKEGNVVDVLPFKFESYNDFDMEEIESFIRGLASFIDYSDLEEEPVKVESKTDKEIGKLNRMLDQQKEKMDVLKKDIVTKKMEGELIYLHFQQVDDLLNLITKILTLKDKQESINKIQSLDFVSVFDPSKNKLIVSLSDTNGSKFDISLNFRKSVSENAEKAYDDSKKLQKKLKGAEKSIEKTEEKLKEVLKKKAVESASELENEKTRFIEKKQRHFWFERYRWSISRNGNLIVAGKDAKSNEQVVKKYLDKKDRYAHADIHGAPSCVIKSKSFNDVFLEISDSTLEDACLFASCYSRAWKQFTEVQAYWVLPEQVSKTPQSGEFVPKGAFIIRGKRNFCKCFLEIGIGLIDLDGEKRWMGGSVESMDKWCQQYFVIRPGNMKIKDIVSLIAKQTETSIDDIMHVLPSGGFTLIRSVGIDGLKKEG